LSKGIQLYKWLCPSSCHVFGFRSLREWWMHVYTSQCYSKIDRPCGKCRGCRIRMCQALIIVLAARGLAIKWSYPTLPPCSDTEDT
jgi:hypothetical protein